MKYEAEAKVATFRIPKAFPRHEKLDQMIRVNFNMGSPLALEPVDYLMTDAVARVLYEGDVS
jgi:hypothetical protein